MRGGWAGCNTICRYRGGSQELLSFILKYVKWTRSWHLHAACMMSVSRNERNSQPSARDALWPRSQEKRAGASGSANTRTRGAPGCTRVDAAQGTTLLLRDGSSYASEEQCAAAIPTMVDTRELL